MPLLSINNLSIGFRGPALLNDISCQIENGQRIGLLGRNGAGKTTLMGILCGQVEPDHGEVVQTAGARTAMLVQDVPRDIHGAVFEVVHDGMAEAGVTGPDWQTQQRVERILSRMQLAGDANFDRLSSGMKRRVLLARALVSEPELLLLDEPTNHLDIDAINWLEDFLLRWQGTLMFVTHDRMFLGKLATRILEIERGQLFDWSCDYATFLQRKQAALAAQEQQDALFDKRLAEEEAWIRRGIKARRTRNEGRVRALKDLRQQRSERRSTVGKVRLNIDEGRRSGNLVADAEGVTFAYEDQDIVRDFSTTIMRGDKLGVIGPNGVGKTTLLRILLGQLQPQKGHVRLGTNIDIAYFDQLREQLDGEKTVQENVGDGYDNVRVGGSSRHVIGYLQDFLFTPERARTPVRFLSGGERNRVLLARLFAKPANVIVLDEPTNDLDTETLELLEERLVEYQGTVLLVSHDRAFLNNVVTSTIAFEPDGVKEYVGGYDDWLRQRAAKVDDIDPSRVKTSTSKKAKPTVRAGVRRLKYKEKQELETLPSEIEQLELQISQLHDAMAQAEFYQQTGEQIAAEQNRLEQFERQLAQTYRRWEELEALAEQ